MTKEARRTFRIGQLNIESVNFALGMIADRMDELEGRRGTPQFKSDIDMGLNKVTSMQAGSSSTDGATVTQVDIISSDVSGLSSSVSGVSGLTASSTPGANRLVMSPSSSPVIADGWLAPKQPIFDHTVTGSAVSSITTNGVITLDGLTHGGYRFEFYIINPAGATSDYHLFVNNDTTTTNYVARGFYGGGTSGNVNTASTTLVVGGLGADGIAIITGAITVTPNFRCNINFISSLQIVAGAKAFSGSIYCSNILSGDNLTRLDIVGPANKIDINSRFRLWRNM